VPSAVPCDTKVTGTAIAVPQLAYMAPSSDDLLGDPSAPRDR
jgi:hypothetical protein